MWLAAGGLAAAFSIRVEDFSLLSAHQTKRALSLPNDPLTMLREIIALWAIWTLLCPFLRLTVTWLKIFLDEIVDETFIVRLSVISRSKARFDPCKITKTSSRSSEAVSHKTSLCLSDEPFSSRTLIECSKFCSNILCFWKEMWV